jgi:hypothetical protein
VSAHVWLHASVCKPYRPSQDSRPSRSALALLPRARSHSPSSELSHRSAQPAGKRAQVRGGGGDASEVACVGAHDALCVRLNKIMGVYICAALDFIRSVCMCVCIRVCERACVVACEWKRTLSAASRFAPFSISTRTACTCPFLLA